MFSDRAEAGRRLGQLLGEYRQRDAVVMALPRGGVPVAAEVARALGAPMDVLVARKLGAPGHPELGIGAVAPGVRILDAGTVRRLRVSDDYLRQVTAVEREEMRRRSMLYRGEAEPGDVRGKTVILVDDGLATGVTARAAIQSLRLLGAREIVLAVPVCAPETADALREVADAVRCVLAPPDFCAVGAWYDDFRQVTDQEVIELLGERSEHLATLPGAA